MSLLLLHLFTFADQKKHLDLNSKNQLVLHIPNMEEISEQLHNMCFKMFPVKLSGHNIITTYMIFCNEMQEILGSLPLLSSTN